MVPPDAAGQRLDVYLASCIPDTSRSRAKRWIDENRVVVGGVPEKPAYKVKAGDVIDVTLPPPEPPDLVAQPIDLDVVYEDDEILVINKPRGMVVHPAKGHMRDTMVNALLFRCSAIRGVGDLDRPGIVHRLDKDTTGLVVVGKTLRSFVFLQEQIRRRTVKRDYLAIVSGLVRNESGVIDAPIGRHPVNRKKMAVVNTGRPAITRFEVLCRFVRHTLLHVHLETGRTHQIRVHMNYVGHPIAGDPLYGNTAGDLGLEGQALHAWQLRLPHPSDGTVLTFRAPPPPDFLRALEILYDESVQAETRARPGMNQPRDQSERRKEIVSWILGIRKEWQKSSCPYRP